jgi:hypothetical protein
MSVINYFFAFHVKHGPFPLSQHESSGSNLQITRRQCFDNIHGPHETMSSTQRRQRSNKRARQRQLISFYQEEKNSEARAKNPNVCVSLGGRQDEEKVIRAKRLKRVTASNNMLLFRVEACPSLFRLTSSVII